MSPEERVKSRGGEDFFFYASSLVTLDIHASVSLIHTRKRLLWHEAHEAVGKRTTYTGPKEPNDRESLHTHAEARWPQKIPGVAGGTPG